MSAETVSRRDLGRLRGSATKPSASTKSQGHLNLFLISFFTSACSLQVQSDRNNGEHNDDDDLSYEHCNYGLTRFLSWISESHK